MKSARPTTSQMCFGFSIYGILDFGYSKHLSEILFWLFQTLELLIQGLFLQTLKFLISAFPNTGTMDFGFPNFGIHCVGFSKYQNSVFWFFPKLELSILAFPHHVFLDFVFF